MRTNPRIGSGGRFLAVLRGQHHAVDLGPNFNDAKIGLIVPDNADVKTVGDLEAKKAEFGSRIVGIDAGAGVMQKLPKRSRLTGSTIS